MVLTGDRNVLIGCAAYGCGNDGLRIETAGTNVIAFQSIGNTGFGARVMATASGDHVHRWQIFR